MTDHIGYDLVVHGNRVHFAISFGVPQEHGCRLAQIHLRGHEVAGFQRIHQNGINAGMSVVDAYHWAYDGWTSEWGPRAAESAVVGRVFAPEVSRLAMQRLLQDANPPPRSEETALVLQRMQMNANRTQPREETALVLRREVEHNGRAREEAAKVACWLMGAVIALLASGVL